MKKLLFIFVLVIAGFAADAQNLQVHYDMGKHRNYVTTTLEMFKPDKYGNTFFFVDFDYEANGTNGVSQAYMEIARCLKFWDAPFSLHVEYDGGLFINKDANISSPINDAWLAGIDYTWNSKDFSKGISLKALYKNIRGNDYQNSFQLTTVWHAHMWDNRITFSGFADLWREKTVLFNSAGEMSSGKFVFIAEPQLWFNLTEKFSVGSEFEFAQDFGAIKGFKIRPTAAVKWNF